MQWNPKIKSLIELVTLCLLCSVLPFYGISLFKCDLYRWLKGHQLNVGLLLDNEFIINRRKFYCQEFIKLLNEGVNMFYLDETYVNSEFHDMIFFCNPSFFNLLANYTPQRLLTDTTVKSAYEVNTLSTVWKSKKFSTIQILREINFGTYFAVQKLRKLTHSHTFVVKISWKWFIEITKYEIDLTIFFPVRVNLSFLHTGEFWRIFAFSGGKIIFT